MVLHFTVTNALALNVFLEQDEDEVGQTAVQFGKMELHEVLKLIISYLRLLPLHKQAIQHGHLVARINLECSLK